MLETVRRYTGDRFSAAKGYDLRKPLSRRRVKTIEKYFSMVEELTSRPHRVITPRKGEKKETFAFTGQDSHPRFTKAIVVIPDATQSYRFEIDKSRPKGSQFTIINKRTKERMFHIPAELFVEEFYEQSDGDDLWDHEEIDPAFFEDVLDEYAERGGVMMIEAGEYHMWGSAGHPRRIAEKLSSLFKQYGASNFDQFNKNSHWIGNWFRGVQVFGDAQAGVYATERFYHELKRLEDRYGDRANQFMGRKIRPMSNGRIGEFYQGELQGSIGIRELYERQGMTPPVLKPRRTGKRGGRKRRTR